MMLGLYGMHKFLVASLAKVALVAHMSFSRAYLSKKCAEAQMDVHANGSSTVRAFSERLSPVRS